uniref:Uncharacterized protein n=1 Tax=Arundo donax TaxID=35708 RepID=A0A0A9DY11_ARUDO
MINATVCVFFYSIYAASDKHLDFENLFIALICRFSMCYSLLIYIQHNKEVAIQHLIYLLDLIKKAKLTHPMDFHAKVAAAVSGV